MKSNSIKIITAIVLAALSISCSKAISDAVHPRLLFTQSDIPAIKQKITGGRSQSAFDLMIARANSHLSLSTEPYNLNDAISGRVLSVQLLNLALSGYLTDNTAYTNKAVDILFAACEQYDVETFNQLNGHLAVGDAAHAYAIAYDWVEPFMTEQQKSLVEQELYSFGQWLYEHSLVDYFGSEEPRRLAHNHQAVAHGGMGLCALVLSDAAPAIWLTRATDKIRSYLDYAVDSTGCAYEGMGYLAYGLQGAVPFAAALAHTGGADIVAEKEVTSLIAQYYMWQLLPWGGSGVMLNQSGSTMKPAGGVMYLIAKNQDSVGLWGWDRMVGENGDESFGQSDWLGAGVSLPYVILWEDAQLQPQSPASAGLGQSKLFSRGQISARDGWEDNNSLATLTSGFGWPGCWNHGDVGSFTFYAKGESFVKDPGAHLQPTIHHSAITVNNEGQDWFAPGSAPTGEIIDYWQQGDATYAKADTKSAYTEILNAQKAIRQFLYVSGNQPYVIITDDFELSETAVKNFQWRLTTDYSNSLIVDEFVRTAHIVGASNGAKLDIKFLSPQIFSLQSRAEGSSYKQLIMSSTGYSGKFVVLLIASDNNDVLPDIVKTGDTDSMQIVLTFSDGITDTVNLNLNNIEFTRQLACNPPQGDFNEDCKIDISDFNIFAAEWLNCTFPAESGCFIANRN